MTRKQFVTKALEIIDSGVEPEKLNLSIHAEQYPGCQCLTERVLGLVYFASIRAAIGTIDPVFITEDFVYGKIDRATFRARIAALAEGE